MSLQESTLLIIMSEADAGKSTFQKFSYHDNFQTYTIVGRLVQSFMHIPGPSRFKNC